MIQSLVKYKKYIQEDPRFGEKGFWQECSEIVEVSNLTELNERFDHIQDVKIVLLR